METTTVTVSLPTEIVRQVEKIAQDRHVSVETLMAETLQHLIQFEADYAAARVDSLAIMAKGFNLGTRGSPLGSRDDLHE
jgi:predicted transcriptional regulator